MHDELILKHGVANIVVQPTQGDLVAKMTRGERPFTGEDASEDAPSRSRPAGSRASAPFARLRDAERALRHDLEANIIADALTLAGLDAGSPGSGAPDWPSAPVTYPVCTPGGATATGEPAMTLITASRVIARADDSSR